MPKIKEGTAPVVVANRSLHVPKDNLSCVIGIHRDQPCSYLRFGGGGGGYVLETRSPLFLLSSPNGPRSEGCLGVDMGCLGFVGLL